MKNISILLVCDSRYQSGAWWRTTGPFTKLRKQYRDINFQFRWMPAEDMRWVDVAGADIAFFHRPYHELHMKIFRMCLDASVPTWLDIDDDLFHIEHDNACFNDYMDRTVHDRMIRMIYAANVVTVSTFELKRQLDRFRPGKDCLLLKNAFDEKDWKYRDVTTRAPEHRVVWRGSHHHQKDLIQVSDDIIRIANKFPDFSFYFVGFKPWWIIENCDNAYTVSQTDVINFHKLLHHLRPDVGIVPLAEGTFNKCKSNIAAQELSMAGGMVVAPAWEEWNIPGVMNYGPGPKAFGITLEQAIDTVKLGGHLENMERTWEFCRREYDLSFWNQRRIQIVLGLLKEASIATYVKEDQIKTYGKEIIPEDIKSIAKLTEKGGKIVEIGGKNDESIPKENVL